MENVEAVRDIEKINAIKKLLKEHSKRDYLLFVLGINTGLKISEILSIKVQDVVDANGSIKRFLEFDSKSKKPLFIYINTKAKQALSSYLSSASLQNSDFLFKSTKTEQPITRQQAYRIINKAARDVGIEGKIGTHSMRKTFGYHAYKKGVAVSFLQKLFHHSSPSETLKYLGIDKEQIKTEIDVNL